jgi:hypothetical protein
MEQGPLTRHDPPHHDRHHAGTTMKLAILSCNRRCYSTRRLRLAAAQRGHDVQVLNTLKFAIDVKAGEPDLYYRSQPLSRYDAVLPRIGASITYFGTAVVRQFEQMDVFCANSSNGITTLGTSSARCRSSASISSASRRPRSSATEATYCRPSHASGAGPSLSSSSKARRASE